jgi:hypothetical protein
VNAQTTQEGSDTLFELKCSIAVSLCASEEHIDSFNIGFTKGFSIVKELLEK